MDKLKVEDKEEEKDADDSSSDPKSSESSGEGVKAESGTTATIDDAQDSTKKDEQTDQQSGPAEWLRENTAPK